MAGCGASVISELTQWSGSLTHLASDLGQMCQWYDCTIPFWAAYIIAAQMGHLLIPLSSSSGPPPRSASPSIPLPPAAFVDCWMCHFHCHCCHDLGLLATSSRCTSKVNKLVDWKLQVLALWNLNGSYSFLKWLKLAFNHQVENGVYRVESYTIPYTVPTVVSRCQGVNVDAEERSNILYQS